MLHQTIAPHLNRADMAKAFATTMQNVRKIWSVAERIVQHPVTKLLIDVVKPLTGFVQGFYSQTTPLPCTGQWLIHFLKFC